MPVKSSESSGTQQVNAFFDRLEHPFRQEMITVRRLLLDTNTALTEHIKWNAPSFCIDGDDRITFNLQGKDHFRLIFHRGAKKKAAITKSHLIEDVTGLLEWPAPDRALLKLGNTEDVAAKAPAIKVLVSLWLEAAG